ncbi:MAG: hypothetical protein WA751_00365 [Candidatus Dormiibacterota bacterium]
MNRSNQRDRSGPDLVGSSLSQAAGFNSRGSRYSRAAGGQGLQIPSGRHTLELGTCTCPNLGLTPN